MIIPRFMWGDILTKTGDDVAIILSDSQQYTLMQLLSLLQQNPEQILTDTASYDIGDIDLALWQTMNALLDNTLVSQWKQSRIQLFPVTRDADGGTMKWVGLSTHALAGYYDFTTIAVNDFVRWNNIAFKKGVWKAFLSCLTGTADGIASLIFDTTTITTVDLYSASNTQNVVKVTGTFTVTSDTIVPSVILKMATKNASSTNYNLRITLLEFERVSD